MSEHDLDEKFTVDDGGSTVPASSVEDPAAPAGGAAKKKKADVKKSVDPKADKLDTKTPGMNEEEASDTDAVEIVEEEVISIDESIAKMFEGMDLSEEFTNKVTLVFEAAVNESATKKAEAMTEEYAAKVDAEMQESVDSTVNTIIENLDSYLDYVVEEWMKENELAVEKGIRAEIVENFMHGLRNLFAENYIDIPEEKVDLVDELAGKVEELEASVNEEVERNIEVKKELVEMKKDKALTDVCEGLTDSQVEKMKSLAEGVDFDEDTYAEKLETIKENYFPKEEVIESDATDEEPLEIEEEGTQVTGSMAAYTQAISRSIKK